jgi:hypothetical protein
MWGTLGTVLLITILLGFILVMILPQSRNAIQTSLMKAPLLDVPAQAPLDVNTLPLSPVVEVLAGSLTPDYPDDGPMPANIDW